MRTIRMLAPTLCLVLALTACADADAPEPSGAAAHGTPQQPTPRPARPDPLRPAARRRCRRRRCAYLDGQLPTLRGIGSETGTMANLTVNLYSWYEKQGAVPTGRQIDDQTRQECPATRTEVLELAGMESFERL